MSQGEHIERIQLEALWARCAEAEDFETLKYELYSYDPEKFAYLGPTMGPETLLTFWDFCELFRNLFNEQDNKQKLNQGGYK